MACSYRTAYFRDRLMLNLYGYTNINGGVDMLREELQNKHGDAICEYCNKNIISKYNIGIGGLCEGQYCEEAQDGYAAENNIELED